MNPRLPHIFSAEHSPRQHQLPEEWDVKVIRECANFRSNAGKELMEICSISAKITENSATDYAMWIATKEIIFVWWKFNCFDELNRKIISKMPPDTPVTHPR